MKPMCIECFFENNKNMKNKYPHNEGKGKCPDCYKQEVNLYIAKEK